MDLVVLDPEVWALGVSGPVADLAVFALVVVLVVFALVVDLVVFVLAEVLVAFALVVGLEVFAPAADLVAFDLVVGLVVFVLAEDPAASGPVVEPGALFPVEELVVLVLLAQLVVGVAVLAEQAFAAAAGPCQWQPQGALHQAP